MHRGALAKRLGVSSGVEAMRLAIKAEFSAGPAARPAAPESSSGWSRRSMDFGPYLWFGICVVVVMRFQIVSNGAKTVDLGTRDCVSAEDAHEFGLKLAATALAIDPAASAKAQIRITDGAFQPVAFVSMNAGIQLLVPSGHHEGAGAFEHLAACSAPSPSAEIARLRRMNEGVETVRFLADRLLRELADGHTFH